MDARGEVVAAAEARALALAAGDAARLAEVLHENFRWTSHTGETFNREDYIRRNTEGQVSWRSQELSGVEVTILRETAVLHAEVLDVVEVNGQAEHFRMPVTQVWVRDATGWRCVAGHAGPRRS